MNDDLPSQPTFEDIEREHSIPAATYCGLSPGEMSRAIIACHSRPGRPGETVSYWPVVSEEIRLGMLREEFGPDADVARIRIQEQFFSSRVSRALKPDWMLPAAEFDRHVVEGLRLHFPELSDDARRVIAGSYSYSHSK